MCDREKRKFIKYMYIIKCDMCPPGYFLRYHRLLSSAIRNGKGFPFVDRIVEFVQRQTRERYGPLEPNVDQRRSFEVVNC